MSVRTFHLPSPPGILGSSTLCPNKRSHCCPNSAREPVSATPGQPMQDSTKKKESQPGRLTGQQKARCGASFFHHSSSFYQTTIPTFHAHASSSSSSSSFSSSSSSCSCSCSFFFYSPTKKKSLRVAIRFAFHGVAAFHYFSHDNTTSCAFILPIPGADLSHHTKPTALLSRDTQPWSLHPRCGSWS